MNKGRRRVWLGFGVAILFVIVIVPGYFATHAGHERAARWLERLLDRAIPGSAKIEAIDSLAPGAVTARGVSFLDPKGKPVLELERVVIDLDLGSALLGVLAFDSARVDGGRLNIAVQPDGRTSLEAAFSAASDDPPDPDRGLQCTLREIAVRDIVLTISPSAGGDTFRFDHVSASLRIWREHTNGIRVDMADVRARVADPKLLGSRVTLTRTEGWVHGAEKQVLYLKFAGHLEDSGRIDGTINYFDRERTPVLVDLYPHGDLKTKLATAMIDVQSWLSEDVKVEVH